MVTNKSVSLVPRLSCTHTQEPGNWDTNCPSLATCASSLLAVNSATTFWIFTATRTPTPHRYPKGLLYYKDLKGKDGYSVTYDDRSFIVAGTRTLLLSGSVHYPRSTPLMWDGLLQEMVQDGLNMVEIYLFWNLHEFKRGQQYNLAGSANWTLFVEKAAAAGLFVNLRIGPYVCAEWNYGEGECVGRGEGGRGGEGRGGGGRKERGRGKREHCTCGSRLETPWVSDWLLSRNGLKNVSRNHQNAPSTHCILVLVCIEGNRVRAFRYNLIFILLTQNE